jgi:hypothetical protein
MALVGRRDGRNFGYGQATELRRTAGVQRHVRRWPLRHGQSAQRSLAGVRALVPLRRGSRYQRCTADRSPDLVGLRGASASTWLERGDLAVSTAQNRLSSVNRTMAALRSDQYVKVPSPSKALEMQRTGCSTLGAAGPRPRTREAARRRALRDVTRCRAPRPSSQLARATGMRLREAISGRPATPEAASPNDLRQDQHPGWHQRRSRRRLGATLDQG